LEQSTKDSPNAAIRSRFSAEVCPPFAPSWWGDECESIPERRSRSHGTKGEKRRWSGIDLVIVGLLLLLFAMLASTGDWMLVLGAC
jgi:hypothetical protein